MKLTRKVLALVLCLVMVMGLATTAAAVDINFTAGAAGAEYSAYKLLNVTVSDDGTKFAYTVNSKYANILKTVTARDNDTDIIGYISDLEASGIRAFADAVYAAIAADKTIVADYTTTADKMEDVEVGYYLLVETALGTDPADTYSLAMLDTVGKDTITVVTKESTPTVDKEVKEVNDSTGVSHWQEHADHDIGDTVEFRITGTVSGRYDNYKTYYYSFADTMSTGLTFNETSVVVTIDGVVVTDYFKLDTNPSTGETFTLTADLKYVDEQVADLVITHNSSVVVTYTAILNENAVSGTAGNTNEIVLKYETNPYYDGTGEPEEPGETPKDINIVFTFDSIVNKVDASGNALEGAGFTLYKYDQSVEGTDKWVTVGTEIKDVTTFRFYGLDVGKYKLVETSIPEGYNKADDIEFEIVAIYDNTKDPVTLTGLDVVDVDGDSLVNPTEKATATFSATLSSGEVSTNVVNNTGSELPETGGMGTTLFYVIGGLMVLGAAVLLVTKKRMTAE